jgi:hypothetical protein
MQTAPTGKLSGPFAFAVGSEAGAAKTANSPLHNFTISHLTT